MSKITYHDLHVKRLKNLTFLLNNTLVSRMLEVSRQTLYSWIRGECKPSLNHIKKIKKLCDMFDHIFKLAHKNEIKL